VNGLRIEGLGIRHDGHAIIRDVTLDVNEGESLCLIGASGSGKSLIAAAVAGLLPDCMAAAGRIHLHDRVVAAADQAGLRTLWHTHSCLLPQEPGVALAPLLGAAAQLRLSSPKLDRAEALRWLARFGLDRRASQRLPFELSGGMAQRLLAALATRTASRVLIADEPTKGLDAVRRADLVALLAGLRDAGRALLVITHDLAVARGLAGRIAVLDGGEVVEHGPANIVLRRPRSRFAQVCIGAESWPATPRRAPGAEVAAGERLVIARAGRALGGPIDIALRQAAVTTLLGPSGVGKTTLGDTILALAPPKSGCVSWLGRRLDRTSRRMLRPRFQKLHQDPTTVFARGRTVGDSLADLRRLDPDTARHLPRLLEQLRVPAAVLGRKPADISGGEAQRIALARTLALQPLLLVADEPCSRLDPPIQAEALLLLRRLADDDGLAVLLLTHDPVAGAALSDDVLEMSSAWAGS